MIGHLSGSVVTRGTNPVIIDVGGVGYRVFVTPRYGSRLHEGDRAAVFIHTHVADDRIELFGFATMKELDLFQLLLSVPGVGPKTALMVSDRGPDAIRQAVSTSDVAFFTTIPRLGKKNAQKIIIELKSKLGSIQELDLGADESGETRELFDALTAMGFAKREVEQAVAKLDGEDRTMEQKIRHALKLLAKSG